MPCRAVFLDRDNTLVFDPGYLSNPEDVQLLDGVVEGLTLLVQAGFALVIVTNQAGVAKGYFDESAVAAVNAEVVRQLSVAGVLIDAVYYCPYHPEGIIEPFNQSHPDRKPNPGMLLRASIDLGIELVHSWMIGDSVHDSEAGKRAGCRTIRIRSANAQLRDDDSWTDHFCSNMLEAADIIIGEL
jgi:D-glycero-D-manno-heptose 1,7-bisphosphate phosphatase